MAERDDKRLPHGAPEPPATDEEREAAARLRDELEGAMTGDPGAPPDALADALRAAWSPTDLDDEAHQAILARALGLEVPEHAPPDADEAAAAERLRAALEGPALFSGARPTGGSPTLFCGARPTGGSPTSTPTEPQDAVVELARALRTGWSPSPLAEADNGALVDRALAEREPARPGAVVALGPRRARVAFAAAGLLALAASLLVYVGASQRPAEVPLAQTRSTQPLFSEPFRPGEMSARIDRIAAARTADYRENRFASWGVR